MPGWTHEKRFEGPVCGIDEAGRGPWAGPVVAAAVILDRRRGIGGLDDSKVLTAGRREELFARIMARAGAVGIGAASAAEIDFWNIHAATLLAMRRAALRLKTQPVAVLVDGKFCPILPWPAEAIVDGDALSVSIAAASIVAKVVRDRAMRKLGRRYPAYGFESHKGYRAPQHGQALDLHGPCPHHRRSFRPVADALRARRNNHILCPEGLPNSTSIPAAESDPTL